MRILFAGQFVHQSTFLPTIAWFTNQLFQRPLVLEMKRIEKSLAMHVMGVGDPDNRSAILTIKCLFDQYFGNLSSVSATPESFGDYDSQFLFVWVIRPPVNRRPTCKCSSGHIFDSNSSI